MGRCLFTVPLFFLIVISVRLNAQGFLRAEGKKIVNQKGNVLLRGMGLGGWMLQEGYMLKVPGEGQQHKIRERIEQLIGPKKTQLFYDHWLANHTRKIDVDSMRSWGFNSVRLPIHYNLFTLPVEQEPVAGKNTWLQKGFAITDSLLAWCKANKIYLILDLHGAPGGQGNDLNISDADTTKPLLWASEANKQKTIALWKKLAQRYTNETWIGGYDILNEPNIGFTDTVNDKHGLQEQKNEPLKTLLMDITKAIRETDKRHMIIIEGNGWGNNYNGMLPPWDNNMVLSFHKYWNFNDQASIKKILDTRDKYNVPVWLGETGENSNVWFTQAIQLLETNNIGWAWWPLKKIGSNNPLEVKSNKDYDALLSYWRGKTSKPAENKVYNGLLELAASTKLEATIFHKDVIDAMFRQPFSTGAMPYKANSITNNTILNAVDYDLGRNGVAYFDNDTANYRTSGKNGEGNRGHTYRNDGVDIRKDSAENDVYYVSDIEDGEWLQFTTDVAREGAYTLSLSIACDNQDGKICINSGKRSLAKSIAIPNTGSLKTWRALQIKNVALAKGKQAIKIYAETGGFNLKSIKFIKE